MVEENPDDAAAEKSGMGQPTPWFCIFHGQFVYPGKGEASPPIPVAISCQPEKNNLYQQYNYNTQQKAACHAQQTTSS